MSKTRHQYITVTLGDADSQRYLAWLKAKGWNKVAAGNSWQIMERVKPVFPYAN